MKLKVTLVTSVTDLHVFENNIYSCKIHVGIYLLLLQFSFTFQHFHGRIFHYINLKKRLLCCYTEHLNINQESQTNFDILL